MSSSTIDTEPAQPDAPEPRKISGAEVRSANSVVVDDVTQKLNVLKAILETAQGKLKDKKNANAIAGIKYLISQINNLLSAYRDDSKFVELWEPRSTLENFKEAVAQFVKFTLTEDKTADKLLRKDLDAQLEVWEKYLDPNSVEPTSLARQRVAALSRMELMRNSKPQESLSSVVTSANRQQQNPIIEMHSTEASYMRQMGDDSKPIYDELVKNRALGQHRRNEVTNYIASINSARNSGKTFLDALGKDSINLGMDVNNAAAHMKNILELSLRANRILKDGELMKNVDSNKNPFILPAQRLPRYNMLLQEMLKQSNEGSPEAEKIKQLLDIAKSHASYFNNAVRLGDILSKHKNAFTQEQYEDIRKMIYNYNSMPDMDKLKLAAQFIATRLMNYAPVGAKNDLMELENNFFGEKRVFTAAKPPYDLVVNEFRERAKNNPATQFILKARKLHNDAVKLIHADPVKNADKIANLRAEALDFLKKAADVNAKQEDGAMKSVTAEYIRQSQEKTEAKLVRPEAAKKTDLSSKERSGNPAIKDLQQVRKLLSEARREIKEAERQGFQPDVEKIKGLCDQAATFIEEAEKKNDSNKNPVQAHATKEFIESLKGRFEDCMNKADYNPFRALRP